MVHGVFLIGVGACTACASTSDCWVGFQCLQKRGAVAASGGFISSSCLRVRQKFEFSTRIQGPYLIVLGRLHAEDMPEPCDQENYMHKKKF